jgi:hypothetical protein
MQNTGYVLRGGYYTFKTNYIQPFPVPENIPIEIQEKVEKLVNEIIEIKRHNPNNKTLVQEKEIDNLIYYLYNFDEKEINIIDNLNHL